MVEFLLAAHYMRPEYRSMLHRLALLSYIIWCLVALPDVTFAQSPRFPAGAEAASRLDPSVMMLKALPLLKTGSGEEAVFWFYAGQLRWRSRLRSHPDQDQTGEPAAFSALMETIGPQVNEWAFGDIPLLQRTIASVLEWDRLHPDVSVPATVAQSTRSGLENLSVGIGRDADRIKRDRAANGLSNR